MVGVPRNHPSCAGPPQTDRLQSTSKNFGAWASSPLLDRSSFPSPACRDNMLVASWEVEHGATHIFYNKLKSVCLVIHVVEDTFQLQLVSHARNNKLKHRGPRPLRPQGASVTTPNIFLILRILCSTPQRGAENEWKRARPHEPGPSYRPRRRLRLGAFFSR